MEQFSLFDSNHTGDLVVLEKGRPYPTFTLTDGIKVYGELSYPNNSQRMINAAQHSWAFGPGKYFSRSIVLNDVSTGQTIAVVKTSFCLARITLEFTDGQIFKFHRPFVFTKKPRWSNEQFGNVLSIEWRPFSIKLDFKVIPELTPFRNNDHLLLMTFVSVHLMIMRKIKAGAVED